MLFDIPYLAGWHNIGISWQKLSDHNTARENVRRADYNDVINGQIMIRKDGILRKSEYHYDGHYTITQVHTNSAIRVQHGLKSERLNIRRVMPYFTAASNDGNN